MVCVFNARRVDAPDDSYLPAAEALILHRMAETYGADCVLRQMAVECGGLARGGINRDLFRLAKRAWVALYC